MDRCIAILHPFQKHYGHIERCKDDNEWLGAMEPRLRLERYPPQAGLEPWTARSVGQRLTH